MTRKLKGLPKMSLLLFSRSITSNSLWFYELQHARLRCPSLSPEVAQTHVPWVNDAIQPSHPLSSPSPPALNFSQNQCGKGDLPLHVWGQWLEKSEIISRKDLHAAVHGVAKSRTRLSNWTELKIISCLSLSEFRLCSKPDIMFSDKRNWGLLLLVTQLTRCQKDTLCSEHWTDKKVR